MIYLDHNATTKIAPEVLAKMIEAYQLPLNNSSSHQLGRKAYQLVEEARTEVQNLFNAKNYQVIFTGSSTEATNQVMFGCDVQTILFCQFEHSSVYSCRPEGKKIIEIDALENGSIDVSHLKNELEKLPDGNFLVSLMLANNETGALQPVEEVAKLTHQKGGLFHCDVVQAAGKIDVDVEKINADFVSISAHKINGPQGVGALLVRNGLDIKPLIHGGKQEKYKRAGTTNIAGVVGFGVACKLAKNRIAAYSDNVKTLRDFLEKEILAIAKSDVKIFSTDISRLPNTSYIALHGVDAQTQLINFDLNGICVSAGPACSSGTLTESRILKAMKIAPEFSISAVRVSLCPETSKTEIENFIKVWKEFYQKNKK